MSRRERVSLFCILFFFSIFLLAQPHRAPPDSSDSVAGRYEGTATNKAGEVITVTLELKDAEGVLSGKIIHRDSVLTGAERAEGKKMLVCVSRGQGSLTLNL